MSTKSVPATRPAERVVVLRGRPATASGGADDLVEREFGALRSGASDSDRKLKLRTSPARARPRVPMAARKRHMARS
jgi:hypothetical protein